jgi:hypothetical protein
MRFYEFSDQGLIGGIKVLQGQANTANKEGDTLVIPFSTFIRMVNGQEYGVTTPEALRQWKDQFDSSGTLIKDIDQNDESNPKVYIKTKNQANSPQPSTEPTGGKTVDQMASRAAKQSLSNQI